MDWSVDTNLIIIIASSLVAAVSFMAFALPFLNKTEAKERYQSIIEKKRKDVFLQAKDRMQNPSAYNPGAAKDDIAMIFKMKQLAGEMGEKLREKMLQAGIRDPKAPIYFLVSRIVLPIILVLFVILIISSREEETSSILRLGGILAAALGGYMIPWLIVKNKIQKRQEEVNLSFPDALDIMLICVQGGIGLEQTINRVAEEMSENAPILAEELGILSAEMGMLNDPIKALQDFAKRVGGSAKSFATAMIQAMQYGTSVSTAMRVISDDLRDQRMALAEQKAAALPPKLTVPMIAFFLPPLFVVIMGPMIIRYVLGDY